MNPRTKLFTALAALALTMLACGVNVSIPDNAIQVGETVTEALQVPAPESGGTVDLTINFGTGKLLLSGGTNEGLVQGTATYNVAEFKPEFSTDGSAVTLDQGSFEYELTGLPNFNDLENTWDLHLSSEPLNLEIRAGAFDGVFDLGNMSLETLQIFGGASSVDMDFSKPNQTEMSTFRYTTGASDVKLLNLANANFSLLTFKAGIGNYTLDFSGDLQRDATIEIEAGLSNVTIRVPEGVPAEIRVDGTLNNVNLESGWQMNGNTYFQDGSGPSLTIRVDIGAGNLNLEN